MSRYRLELSATTPRTATLLRLAKLRGESWQYLVFKAIDRYLDDNMALLMNLQTQEQKPPTGGGTSPIAG